MDQITLKNFRCFREQQTARLAPLTLLVGENSTGKTSFMALVRALWDTACRHRIPDFKEAPYDLGSFDEIVHRGKSGAGCMEIVEAGFEATFENKRRSTVSSRKFDVAFGKKGTVPAPAKRRLSDSNGSVWMEHSRRPDGKWQFLFGTPNGSWRSSHAAGLAMEVGVVERIFPFFLFTEFLDVLDTLSTDGGVIPLSGSERPGEDDRKLIKNLHESVPFSDRPLYASAPIRSKPHRTYDPARPSSDPEGSNIPMYLADIYFQNRKKWKAVKDTLEKFGEESGLFDEISIRSFGKAAGGPFQVRIKKYGQKVKGPRRNLIDVGYGVSQVLPVITELFRDDATPMFLLQQPEVHLHPSAQAALGSLFCRIAGKRRQLVVETHSDHLLDRVRMDVRDGRTKLTPDDVSILFFERDELEVRIHSLRLDGEGNVLNAPPTYRRFFLDETNRSLGL